MRHLSVVLAGIMLLSVAACEAQAKPERKEQKEKSKAPDKGKAAPRVFKIYKPYHLLPEVWTMRYGGRYVLIEAAFQNKFEARKKCKGAPYLVPGFLLANLDPKLWYCISLRASDVPLPRSVLTRHKPANPLLSKHTAFTKYAGAYQAVDTGSVKVLRKGLRFITAFNEKVLLALAMVPRIGFRPKGKEVDYGVKWPLDPRRYKAHVWTIGVDGKTIGAVSFETCGITSAELRRFSDGNCILMLSETHGLPRNGRRYLSRFYVWSPDGVRRYSTVAKHVIPWDVPKDEVLPGNTFYVLHENDTEGPCCEMKWDARKGILLKSTGD